MTREEKIAEIQRLQSRQQKIAEINDLRTQQSKALEPIKRDDPVNFDVGKMVSNIPSSAAKYGKNLVHAAVNPIDTALAIPRMISGGIEKLTPGTQIYEKDFDAMVDLYKDKYGSVDKFKTALMNDPVDIGMDAAAVLTGGAGSTAKLAANSPKIVNAANKISKAAQMADPINIAGGALKYGASKVTPLLHNPKKNIMAAANLPAKMSEKARQQYASTVLEDQIPQTREGLNRVRDVKKETYKAAGKLRKAANDRGVTMPVEDLYKGIPDVVDVHGGVGPDAIKNEAAIAQAVKDTSKSIIRKKGKPYKKRRKEMVKSQNKMTSNMRKEYGSKLTLDNDLIKADRVDSLPKLDPTTRKKVMAQINAELRDDKNAKLSRFDADRRSANDLALSEYDKSMKASVESPSELTVNEAYKIKKNIDKMDYRTGELDYGKAGIEARQSIRNQVGDFLNENIPGHAKLNKQYNDYSVVDKALTNTAKAMEQSEGMPSVKHGVTTSLGGLLGGGLGLAAAGGPGAAVGGTIGSLLGGAYAYRHTPAMKAKLAQKNYNRQKAGYKNLYNETKRGRMLARQAAAQQGKLNAAGDKKPKDERELQIEILY